MVGATASAIGVYIFYLINAPPPEGALDQEISFGAPLSMPGRGNGGLQIRIARKGMDAGRRRIERRI